MLTVRDLTLRRGPEIGGAIAAAAVNASEAG